ncbi:MAG: glycosyltransferase [Burkholderiales bacterium]
MPSTTLILLACNQQATARAAADSCLAQIGDPLEIVLSDDASSDGTFAELQAAVAAYRGPHRVRARRNPVNLGIGAHYNQLLAETSGELIVTAAGDDFSLPHRVQRLRDAWENSGRNLDLIASHFIDMAPDGALGPHVVTDDLATLTLAGWCAKRPYTVGATHAFTRRMMQRFGPFIENIWYEDPVMALRALAGGGAITLREPLVHYRRGGTSRWPSARHGEQLMHWVRTQNCRVLAEIRQHTLDARLAGIETEVAEALAPTLARETCLAAMLDAPNTAQRWLACRSARGLPLGWRVRKFMTFSCPDQAASLKSAKARWRGR